MEWDRDTFAHWLKYQRRVMHPMSQDKLASYLGEGVTQSKVSRWEEARDNTAAPTLEECLILADLFEVNFIKLAELCGRWNDTLQERVLVALDGADSRQAPVAQLAFPVFAAVA